MNSKFQALVGAALVCAGLTVGIPPAYASQTCGTAVDMVPGSTQMGTATVQGTTGTFERSDWWRHTGTPAPRTVTVSGDNEIDLYVHDNCGNATPICQSAANGPDTCTVTPSGDIFIEVRLRLPATFANYTLSVATPPPTQCSDGVDNDADGATDFPADRHCTSLSDPTEAAVQQMVTGGMTWGVDTSQSPITVTLVRWGVLQSRYTCSLPNDLPIRIVCDANPDPNVQWVCSTFPLQADAPSMFQANDPTKVGNVSGWMTCDSGNVLRTADVIGRGSARTTNQQANVNLGTGDRITCGSAGVLGGANGDGSFSVTCGPIDPGVVWPYGEPPAAGRLGDAVVEVFRL
jgi:hypothetical protein